MALTQQQWYDKLVSFVPGWFFESERRNVAYFKGMAKILSDFHQNAEDHVDQTFLLKSTDQFTDIHASERSLRRLNSEPDLSLGMRTQSLTNKSDPVDLKKLIDQFLIKGECVIREHEVENPGDVIFASRGSFLNHQEVFTSIYYNTFSVVVDKQIHDPYSFTSRGNFLDRGDFVSSDQSSQNVFDLILETVNNEKLSGTLYRIIERAG